MANSELSSVHQRSQRRLPPSPRAAPWLVYEHGKEYKFQTFYNICDHPISKSYTKYIPELSFNRFWQKPCHQGWLVILRYDSEYGECFLWNPASLETIQLPNFLRCVPYEYRVMDCVLSSPPQTSSISGTGVGDGKVSIDDSIVYILLDGREKPVTLIYCHPGAEEWRKHEFVNVRDREIANMFYFKGKLYIMSSNGDEDMEIEIQHGSDNGDEETLSSGDFSTTFKFESFHSEEIAGSLDCFFTQHWIAYSGEVFSIRRKVIQRGIYDNCVTKIIIRRLDFSTMSWVEVKSLDDYVFFLSNTVQLCCLASELGLPKGCVYFTHDDEMSLYKYDLEGNSILLSVPCPDLPKPWLVPKWLMIPTTDHMFRMGVDVDQVITAIEYNTDTRDKDNEKEDIEEVQPWFILSDDFIWLISNYLHTLDYIHLRAVSKKYRSILKQKRSLSTRTTLHTTGLSPWLVLSNYDHDQQVFSFVNPKHNNENHFIKFPEWLRGSTIRFSKDGWLLMSKYKTLFFYNPFNRSTVKVPDLPECYRSYIFSGISFSSSPTSADCVVFAINEPQTHIIDIFYIKRGDESWSIEEFNHNSSPPIEKHLEFEPGFNNPVFYHGAFYCLGINGTLGVSKVCQENISWEVLTKAAPPKCDFIYKSFLVECEGKLVSVLLGHLGKWVRVFRLDDTKMVWVEVKNLGQHMLFLSNTSSISAMAPTSQMKNKIYFPRLHNKGVLYYSLDSGMYHCLGSTHSAKDYRDSEESLHCSWIEPNWLETSSGHNLDWLSI